jgi:hypothetical protein
MQTALAAGMVRSSSSRREEGEVAAGDMNEASCSCCLKCNARCNSVKQMHPAPSLDAVACKTCSLYLWWLVEVGGCVVKQDINEMRNDDVA